MYVVKFVGDFGGVGGADGVVGAGDNVVGTMGEYVGEDGRAVLGEFAFGYCVGAKAECAGSSDGDVEVGRRGVGAAGAVGLDDLGRVGG
jgi:hypothetical protein